MRKNIKHKTTILNLPCEIDVKMVELIKHLNELEGVNTLYCCHGRSKIRKEYRDSSIDRPYASIRYRHKRPLFNLIRAFEKKEKLYEFSDSHYYTREVVIRFQNQNQLKRFTNFLKER